MDLRRHVINGLDQSLIPFANRTGEVRSSRRCANFSTSCAVHEETWGARPVERSSSSTRDKISKDLTIDLKSNLLGENRGKLNLSIQVVVCVEVLTKLGGPLSLQLLGASGDSHRIHLDVDLGDGSLGFKSPVCPTANRPHSTLGRHVIRDREHEFGSRCGRRERLGNTNRSVSNRLRSAALEDKQNGLFGIASLPNTIVGCGA